MEVRRPPTGLPSRLAMDTLPLQTKLFVRDLADGEVVDTFFVVRERSRREKRNGEGFLKLQLGDNTGAVEAVCWDCSDELWQAAAPGSVVRAAGPYSVHPQYGATLTVRALRRAADGEYDPVDMIDGPSIDYDQMVADLRTLVATIQHPSLRELLRRFFAEDSRVWARWSQAPAAK